MRTLGMLVAAMAAIGLLSSSDALAFNPKPVVVPAVKEWKGDTGYLYFSNGAKIYIDGEESGKAADLLIDDINVMNCFTLTKVQDGDMDETRPFDVTMKLEKESEKDLGHDGYTLSILGPIEVKAATYRGLFYATRTLLQLVKQSTTLPRGVITDVPDVEMRFYHIDMARKYYTVESLKRQIREMSWFKMNLVMFHLVDAEAFRLQTTKWPELYDPKFAYSKEQIADIIAFAKERGIEVMPGYEFPGHNTIVNDHFKTGLGFEDKCPQDSVYDWVTPDWVMDMTKTEALDVAKQLLEETMPWFESKYVHIGADELPESLSSNCDYLKKFFKDDPLLTSLQAISVNFVNQLNAFIKSKGKVTVIYNGLETMSPKTIPLDKDIVLHCWSDVPNYEAMDGHQILVSGSGRSGPTANSDLYLTPDQHHYTMPHVDRLMTYWRVNTTVLGYGLCAWSDYMYWSEDEFFEIEAILPRAIVAARLWSAPVGFNGYSVDDFTHRMYRVGPGDPNVKDAFVKPRFDKIKLVHHYDFEEAPYPSPAWFQAAPLPNCQFIKDRVGVLDGSTYIYYTTELVDGRNGQAIQIKNGRDGVGFGGVDMPEPWTFSVWAKAGKAEAINTDANIMVSQYGALVIKYGKTGDIGFTDFRGGFNRFVPMGCQYPVGGEWHHITYTAELGHTTFYIDGEKKCEIDDSIPLPLMSLSGHSPPYTGDRRFFEGLLDDIKVFDGAATAEQVKKIMDDDTYRGETDAKLVKVEQGPHVCPKVTPDGGDETTTTTGTINKDPAEDSAVPRGVALSFAAFAVASLLA